MRPEAMRRWREVAAGVLLVALAAGLYAPVTSLFWTYDDPFNLRYAASYSPVQYFFDPEIWGQLPFRMFTPLLFLSLDADLAWFGFSSRWFYLHHLVSLALAALALYAAARLWLDRPEAFAVGAFFLLGIPTVTCVQQLMVRHYIEGLALAALALAAYVLSVRRSNVPLALAAAFLALLAMLAKEIYVPLPLLFPLLREGDRSRRLLLAAPSLVALVVYLVWRVVMIGTVGGGYAWAVPPGETPRLIAALPVKLGVALSGGIILGWLVLGIALVGFVATALRRPVSLVVFALALAPLAAVASVVEPRYALLPWGVLAATAVLGTTLHLPVSRSRLVLVIFGILLLIANRAAWQDVSTRMQQMSLEAASFLKLPASDMLAKPLSPPATMAELRKLKEGSFGAGEGAGWYDDELFLCKRSIDGRIWTVADGRMREVTRDAILAADRYCAAIRNDAPLGISAVYRDGALYWNLGPYREGQYAFILAGGMVRYDMPAVAGFRMERLPSVTFHVKYESPAGWVTYSPELTMDLYEGRRLEWTR